MIRITKIKVKDLSDFIISKEYISLTEKPISILRANSYKHNPNADKEDVVLYMAFDNLKLIAYRTVFSDTFLYQNTRVKFGWLSGNWVAEKYRRSGLSTRLFEAVYKDWKGKLMYTNYAIASKSVYDKTNTFLLLKHLKGYRYYRRFCLQDLLAAKSTFLNSNKNLLKGIDTLFNFLLDFRFRFKKTPQKSRYYYRKGIKWDSETNAFLTLFKAKELFSRKENTYKWVFNYPWIKTDNETKEQSKKYYFSSYEAVFNSDFYQIYHQKKLVGIVLLSIRGQSLKLPYSYLLPEAVKEATNLIVDLCKTHKINYISIYNDAINKELQKNSFSFLKVKKFEQKFFVTKKLAEAYPKINLLAVQTGDGDVVFT